MSNGKLMIWTIPRTKSTIISKSISSNKNIYCFFEPFFFTYMNKFTFEDLEVALKNEFFARNGPAFCKEMPVYLDYKFEKWIGKTNVKHAILIRNPTEVALSAIIMDGKKVPFLEWNHIFTLEEYWRALHQTKNFLEHSGKTFKVFDSTYLNSETCENFMNTLCDFGELPFEAETMLNMTCYDDYPDNWWVPKSEHTLIEDEKNNQVIDFFGSALKSTSFGSHKSSFTRENITSAQLNRLEAILQVCQPVYDHLKNC